MNEGALSMKSNLRQIRALPPVLAGMVAAEVSVMSVLAFIAVFAGLWILVLARTLLGR
jgi:hypothetical protein